MSSNGVVQRLALIFVAVSCSLPLLLMIHAPPLPSHGAGEEDIQFPGQDSRNSGPHLRALSERASMMVPKGDGAAPLPPPPVISESTAVFPRPVVVESRQQEEAPLGVVPLPPTGGFASDFPPPPLTSSEEGGEAVASSAGTGGGGGSGGGGLSLVKVSEHNELESEESMLGRMSDPPVMEDVISYLDAFIRRLHKKFLDLKQGSKFEVYEAYRAAAERVLLPFDAKWRGRTMFPVRHGEGSIFLSIASYRDHRLENTLKEAFQKAEHPEKLFVGVVMQNCFGDCKTGVHRVSPLGEKPVRTEISDAPPDANGVADFCGSGEPFASYCANGQVRLLTVREEEALGPCVARYFASKLWGGEEYFVQIDSHIWFVEGWDSKLIQAMRAAPSKRPVLSTYPPGYGGHWEGKPGPRMCGASFSSSPVEARIIRIGASMVSAQLPAPEGTPIPAPYVAAGFFAAPSDFLRDLPFDPFLPWVFMGEEIMLSSRFFTAGYDIFAPRTNLLAHEYRPGSMGLPKFWETVGRVFGRPGFNTQLMHIGICRVKNYMGYPECMSGGADLVSDGVLFESEHYGMGSVRTLDQFLDFAGIDMANMHIAPSLPWCNKGADPPFKGWTYATEL